ncbi:hypothetical protein [Parabacteroides pacaensis]|nr:hypothetical protein [Parabacteroides pacaensis]
MFDIFKKDIKVVDKVSLYFTTVKEPEGTFAGDKGKVIEIKK